MDTIKTNDIDALREDEGANAKLLSGFPRAAEAFESNLSDTIIIMGRALKTPPKTEQELDGLKDIEGRVLTYMTGYGQSIVSTMVDSFKQNKNLAKMAMLAIEEYLNIQKEE